MADDPQKKTAEQDAKEKVDPLDELRRKRAKEEPPIHDPANPVFFVIF